MPTPSLSEVFKVPDQHRCFADHFPGNPIVPGALLLDWLCQLIEKNLPGTRVEGIRTMKFLATLHPGDECLLTINQKNSGQVSLLCQRDGQPICKGSIALSKLADS